MNNTKLYRGVKHQHECDCSQVNGTLMAGYWSAHCTAIFHILQPELSGKESSFWSWKCNEMKM